jgi:hypothetical protein
MRLPWPCEAQGRPAGRTQKTKPSARPRHCQLPELSIFGSPPAKLWLRDTVDTADFRRNRAFSGSPCQFLSLARRLQRKPRAISRGDRQVARPTALIGGKAPLSFSLRMTWPLLMSIRGFVDFTTGATCRSPLHDSSGCGINARWRAPCGDCRIQRTRQNPHSQLWGTARAKPGVYLKTNYQEMVQIPMGGGFSGDLPVAPTDGTLVPEMEFCDRHGSAWTPAIAGIRQNTLSVNCVPKTKQSWGFAPKRIIRVGRPAARRHAGFRSS